MKYGNTKEIKISFIEEGKIASISTVNELGDDIVEKQFAMGVTDSEYEIIRCVIELLLEKKGLLSLATKEFGRNL